MVSDSSKSFATVEATVTSKGQVTLPSALRKRLGIGKGSRIRFGIAASGEVRMEPVRYRIDDLWKMADEGGKPRGVMTFAEMDAAKARRRAE